MIEFTKPSLEDLEQLVNLLMIQYMEETNHVSYLPKPEEMKSLFTKSISKLIDKGMGLIALEDAQILGYMIGLQTGPLFGNHNGIVVPMHGHACIPNKQHEVYSSLYAKNADQWVKLGLLSHAIVLFAHNEIQKDFWFENGFGKRCVDALSLVKSENHGFPKFTIKKADVSDLPNIAELHREHTLYYRNSPIFMPNKEEDSLEDLKNWFNQKNHHLWFSVINNEVLGYMRIQPRAESIVSYHNDVMNITGAYVKTTSRHQNIGSCLLEEVMNWLKSNDIPLCGVDYESINPIGAGFWEKHFTPYAISLTRRIDERILE